MALAIDPDSERSSHVSNMGRNYSKFPYSLREMDSFNPRPLAGGKSDPRSAETIQGHSARQSPENPEPVFTASLFAPNWESLFALGFSLLIAILSLASLLIYLRRLQTDWTVPLGAASVFLTGFVICGALFNRVLNMASAGTYEALERDILLDQLDAKEIRARFIRHTLGPETSAWLDELLSSLKVEDDRMAKLCESARKRLEEANSIDLQYPAERKSRAKKILDELTSGIRGHKAQLENVQFQMEVFFQSHKTQREREALERWTSDLKVRTEDAKKIIQSARELLAQTNQLIEK